MEKEEKKTGIAGKIDKLQKQYNKILVDLFKEHAEEAIEQAIEGTTGPIGGNITEIIQSALDSLRTIVEGELGITNGECDICDGDGPGMGIGLGGIALEIGDGEDEESEDEEHEENETDEEESEEHESEDDEEDEDEAVTESFSTGSYLPSW